MAVCGQNVMRAAFEDEAGRATASDRDLQAAHWRDL